MDIQAIQDLRPDVIEALRELKPRFKLCGPLKILVVVDGSIGLGGGFGIGSVVSLLEGTTRGWVDFRVTTAHRSSTTFTDALLNQYHQLWLFGIDGGSVLMMMSTYLRTSLCCSPVWTSASAASAPSPFWQAGMCSQSARRWAKTSPRP